MYLTKSDFKVCHDCRTRLYYRKNGYRTTTEDNEYLQFLADGGFMIECIAKARFPNGVDLAEIRSAADATARTTALLAAGDATIFEAGIIHGNFHVRTDILRKTGRGLELIEVKSSGVDDDEDDAQSPFLNQNGTIKSRWRKYLLDVAFQANVLRRAFPDLTVSASLCVVNKGRAVEAAETLGNFSMRKDRANPRARPTVTVRGDLAALRNSALLVTRNVDHEVSLLMAEVIAGGDALAALIVGDQVQRVQEPIPEFYRKCRTCDYRVEGARSGFNECWGPLADTVPHILELHRVGQIATGNQPDPVRALLESRRASILDLTDQQLGGANSYTVRRRMQWTSLRDHGAEHLPQALRTELEQHQQAPGWPLHFIDFEACDIALPHHAGLRPFERVAFQWSCQTLTADRWLAETHWLNDEKQFPNFAFARTLREQLGEQGTVYVWSTYEQITLRKVLEQILAWLERDPAAAVRLSGLPDLAALRDLAAWIDRLLGPVNAANKRVSPRIRDLHQLAAQHYFHPRMGGRTSIKVVLPAVWESVAQLRNHPAFARYLVNDPQGHPLDPYASLMPLPFGDDDEEEQAVREGTGAIRVYQDLLYADDATDEGRRNRRQLLLQYCELDTAAMVMIWAHWLGRYDFAPR